MNKEKTQPDAPKKPETITVFGDKVAFTELDFAMEGEIIFPEIIQKKNGFRIGKAIAIGDGMGIERVGHRTIPFPGKMFVAVGDAIIFQVPKMTTLTSACAVRGLGLVNVIIQSDCLARVKPTKTDIIGEVKYVVGLETIEVLGDYLLLSAAEVEVEDSIILRPDTAPDITKLRFKVLQMGAGGDWTKAGFGVGDTVLIERLRAEPFMIRTENPISKLPRIEEYYWLHRDYVLGILGDEA